MLNLTLKTMIFVASVSDELQILQQPDVLQHANYCISNEKISSGYYSIAWLTLVPLELLFELQSAFKISALDLRERNQ